MIRVSRDSPAGHAYLDLQNRARREKLTTQELLTMYVVERWLARLARSPYAQDFVLKGGMLLAAFGHRRPTADADTLARNMAADEETAAGRVAEIARIPDPDDGVVFQPHTMTAEALVDSRVCFFEKKFFLDLLNQEPSVTRTSGARHAPSTMRASPRNARSPTRTRRTGTARWLAA